MDPPIPLRHRPVAPSDGGAGGGKCSELGGFSCTPAVPISSSEQGGGNGAPHMKAPRPPKSASSEDEGGPQEGALLEPPIGHNWAREGGLDDLKQPWLRRGAGAVTPLGGGAIMQALGIRQGDSNSNPPHCGNH